MRNVVATSDVVGVVGVAMIVIKPPSGSCGRTTTEEGVGEIMVTVTDT